MLLISNSNPVDGEVLQFTLKCRVNVFSLIDDLQTLLRKYIDGNAEMRVALPDRIRSALKGTQTISGMVLPGPTHLTHTLTVGMFDEAQSHVCMFVERRILPDFFASDIGKKLIRYSIDLV